MQLLHEKAHVAYIFRRSLIFPQTTSQALNPLCLKQLCRSLILFSATWQIILLFATYLLCPGSDSSAPECIGQSPGRGDMDLNHSKRALTLIPPGEYINPGSAVTFRWWYGRILPTSPIFLKKENMCQMKSLCMSKQRCYTEDQRCAWVVGIKNQPCA